MKVRPVYTFHAVLSRASRSASVLINGPVAHLPLDDWWLNPRLTVEANHHSGKPNHMSRMSHWSRANIPFIEQRNSHRNPRSRVSHFRTGFQSRGTGASMSPH